ncbi:Hypothetical protein Minf_0384 [Methylacidiphilum infernorum V4]|uniref:Uncharacterized protein n=1 Tax=Methylacidiphilum infernorum (isolate V4) TaxID=481448 RepID=B3DYS0_METI4|nr:Hypothetical protein Minf_0384 [Methylacidiphilum infernorum V4]
MLLAWIRDKRGETTRCKGCLALLWGFIGFMSCFLRKYIINSAIFFPCIAVVHVPKTKSSIEKRGF